MGTFFTAALVLGLSAAEADRAKTAAAELALPTARVSDEKYKAIRRLREHLAS